MEGYTMKKIVLSLLAATTLATNACFSMDSSRSGKSQQAAQDESNNKFCVICQEHIRTTDTEPVTVTSCNHTFHTACLTPWLQRVNMCPLCKKNLRALQGMPHQAGNIQNSQFNVAFHTSSELFGIIDALVAAAGFLLVHSLMPSPYNDICVVALLAILLNKLRVTRNDLHSHGRTTYARYNRAVVHYEPENS